MWNSSVGLHAHNRHHPELRREDNSARRLQVLPGLCLGEVPVFPANLNRSPPYEDPLYLCRKRATFGVSNVDGLDVF